MTDIAILKTLDALLETVGSIYEAIETDTIHDSTVRDKIRYHLTNAEGQFARLDGENKGAEELEKGFDLGREILRSQAAVGRYSMVAAKFLKAVDGMSINAGELSIDSLESLTNSMEELTAKVEAI